MSAPRTACVKVSIPAGTESGRILRLKGKGFPYINSRERGNMYLKIEVDIPRHVGLKAKRLLKELSDELGTTERPTPTEFEA